jgi:glycosyltransferase involved in cell wall biosynthesis
MKIGVVHSIYKPDTRGGAEIVVENIVNGLKSRGHEVFVVAVGYENKSEIIDETLVYRLKHFNLFNFFDLDKHPVWQRFFWHIIDVFNDGQTWQAFKIFQKEKPELVITNSLMGIGYEIVWLLRILKIRNIHVIHDMQLLHPSCVLDEQVALSLTSKVYSILCRLVFGSPAVVVFPSEYIHSVYQRFKFFKKSDCRVIGNPLPNETKFAIRKKKVPPASEPIIFAYVGQVEEYKGIIDLIKAVNGLGGNYRLLIAGDGAALPEATRWSIDNKQIEFLGRLTPLELEQKIWSHADILVNPSRVPESFGLNVVEAYARGLPVVAARIGALQSIVKEGQTGWLFKSKDQSDLKRLLEFILSNRDKIPPLKPLILEEAKKYRLDNYLSELLK